MKTFAMLSDEQQEAITKIYESNKLLLAPMGRGKTVIAATAISELLRDKVLTRVLVVTTKTIAENVWEDEFNGWEHLNHITCKSATGTPGQRQIIFADSCVDVVVVTFGTVHKLVESGDYKKFDGLLIDETSKIKSISSLANKALKLAKVQKHFKWICGLSATPAGQSLADLYGQMRVIDNGQSLGTSYERFCYEYFKVRLTDFGLSLTNRYDTVDRILSAVKGSIHSMTDNREEVLPALLTKQIWLDMPAGLRKKYKYLESEGKLDSTIAMSTSQKKAMMRQLACGFIYTDDSVLDYSDYRKKEFLSLIEKLKESGNLNVAITYAYTEDRDFLLANLPNDKTEYLTSKNAKKLLKRWNNNEIKYLVFNPVSAGHGAHMQLGGYTLIWYSPQYSNDAFRQTIGRLWRTGQTKDVTVYELLTRDTIDEEIRGRLSEKEKASNELNEKLLTK